MSASSDICHSDDVFSGLALGGISFTSYTCRVNVKIPPNMNCLHSMSTCCFILSPLSRDLEVLRSPTYRDSKDTTSLGCASRMTALRTCPIHTALHTQTCGSLLKWILDSLPPADNIARTSHQFKQISSKCIYEHYIRKFLPISVRRFSGQRLSRPVFRLPLSEWRLLRRMANAALHLWINQAVMVRLRCRVLCLIWMGRFVRDSPISSINRLHEQRKIAHTRILARTLSTRALHPHILPILHLHNPQANNPPRRTPKLHVRRNARRPLHRQRHRHPRPHLLALPLRARNRARQNPSHRAQSHGTASPSGRPRHADGVPGQAWRE